MPASTAMPDIKVEIAFATNPFDASPTWEDVSDYVEAGENGGPISITRGRSDELSEIQPSVLTLTLDNTDGRFTPGNAAGAYFPNVKKGRRIRVTATWQGIDYPRFDGYVDEWPVEWPDGSTTGSTVTIGASSRQSTLPRFGELRSVIEQEVFTDDPVLHYPLNEPSGATTASPSTPTTQASRLSTQGTGSAFTFGNDAGPTTDGYTALHVDAGKYLGKTFTDPLVARAQGVYVLEATFTNVDDGSVRCVAMLSNEAVTNVAAFLVDDFAFNNRLTAEIRYQNGTTIDLGASSGGDVRDGAVHHAFLIVNDLGTSIQHRLYVDGSLVDTEVTSAVSAIPAMNVLSVGGGIFLPFLGSIAHVALYDHMTGITIARIGEHADANLTGFAGETSDARITRLARYAGIDAADLSLETGVATVDNQHTEGSDPLALMREVEATEGGLLFDGRDGLLTFHARSHRYDSTSALTLDVDAQELERDLTFKLDDFGLTNDITVTDAEEASVRAISQDSIDAYGFYRSELTALTTSDAELQSMANRVVNRYAEPIVRTPSASVSLSTLADASKVANALTVDLGSSITLDNLASQAPDSSMRFFVEGYAEDIGADTYVLKFNLSPAELSDVWVLGSTTYSVLGSTTRLA